MYLKTLDMKITNDTNGIVISGHFDKGLSIGLLYMSPIDLSLSSRMGEGDADLRVGGSALSPPKKSSVFSGCLGRGAFELAAAFETAGGTP